MQGFPTRGAKQHLRGCKMVIQTLVLHYCITVLSCSVHPVLIVLHNLCLITACLVPDDANLQEKKKTSTHAISAVISILRYFRNAKTYYNILWKQEHIIIM